MSALAEEEEDADTPARDHGACSRRAPRPASTAWTSAACRPWPSTGTARPTARALDGRLRRDRTLAEARAPRAAARGGAGRRCCRRRALRALPRARAGPDGPGLRGRELRGLAGPPLLAALAGCSAGLQATSSTRTPRRGRRQPSTSAGRRLGAGRRTGRTLLERASRRRTGTTARGGGRGYAAAAADAKPSSGDSIGPRARPEARRG